MATEVIMPKAGMAMETGQIIRWLKSEGDYVNAGEPLVEIETDKVSMEVEAEASGFLLKLLHGPGDTVPVTETIGFLGEKDEEIDVSDRQNHGAVASAQHASPAKEHDLPTDQVTGDSISVPDDSARIAATPAAKRRAKELSVDIAAATPSGPRGEVKLRDVEAVAAAEETTGGRSRDVSSLARKIAEDEAIDISGIEGSGPGGRIVRADVIAALSATRQAVPGESGPERHIDMNNVRRTISRRMLQSHLTMPPVTLDARIDVTELMSFRKQLNESSDRRFSLNDFILKATARAVRDHESVRTAIDGEQLVVRDSVNIGVAVATEHGLLVPVIRDADTLTLGSISDLTHDVSDRARSGKLSAKELTGGTFTVTNLGMYRIHSFTPIINPPQSAILGVNAAEPALRKSQDGDIVERMYMILNLTIDHRAIDGADGAQFLADMRNLLEHPMQILV